MRWRLNVFVFGLLFLSATMTASAAEPIVRSARLPETTPWNLKQLSEPPAFEWLDEKSSVRSLFYTSEAYGGKATRVFAYYATPATLSDAAKRDEKYPAVVLIHGGGGTAFREWAELWAKRGYAAIAMDLAGHRPNEGQNAHQPNSRTRLPDGGPNQGDDEKFGSVDKPPSEQWSYHAVAAAIRAHSLIRSFPEVDSDRTAVTGISWGGYLTCIVAGLDNRFQAAVPVYGCGFLHQNSVWLARFEKMSPEQRQRWVSLWDPSQYLSAVSMPILFVNGTNDFAYPLDSYQKCFDLVPAAKQLRVSVNLPHSHTAGWAPPEIGLFIDHRLGRGAALPSLTDPQIENGRVRVTVQSATKLKQAALHYTTDGDAINKRTWKTIAATIDGGTISVEAAPAEATAWFVTVTDERDALISSRISIR
ncbi:MAG: alpha/beta hydrolase family protein [Planctomycetaceae bacterium]